MRLFIAATHHGVECRGKRAARKLGAYFGQALIDVVMRRKRASRENNPLGVTHETLFGHSARHRVVGHIEKRRCVANARGGAHNNRRVIALGKLERLFHHGKALFGGRRIKHGHFREGRITTRVLLGLGRDGTRIVGHIQHHATPDAHVIHAHQRVACHVHTHLLAGIQRARARVRSARQKLKRGFLVRGPLHMHAFCCTLRVKLGDGFHHFRRWRSGVSRHHTHARLKCRMGKRLVSHQELFHCASLFSFRFALLRFIWPVSSRRVLRPSGLQAKGPAPCHAHRT